MLRHRSARRPRPSGEGSGGTRRRPRGQARQRAKADSRRLPGHSRHRQLLGRGAGAVADAEAAGTGPRHRHHHRHRRAGRTGDDAVAGDCCRHAQRRDRLAPARRPRDDRTGKIADLLVAHRRPARGHQAIFEKSRWSSRTAAPSIALAFPRSGCFRWPRQRQDRERGERAGKAVVRCSAVVQGRERCRWGRWSKR